MGDLIALPPLPEAPQPVIHRGVAGPPDVVVDPLDHHHRLALTVDFRKDTDADLAYARAPIAPIILNENYPRRCGIGYPAYVLTKVQDGVYAASVERERPSVYVKQYDIQVVDTYSYRMQQEDPFLEIWRMQQYGDNVHVLIVEALKTDEYLYIIVPYCEKMVTGGTLPESFVRDRYNEIVDNMNYLHARGICHNNLTLDNCMMLNNRVVFKGLGLSFLIPPSDLVWPHHEHVRNDPYLPPERVHLDVLVGLLPFSAKVSDLYATGVILFELLVGELPYEIARFDNHKYRLLIQARFIDPRSVDDYQHIRDYIGEMGRVMTVEESTQVAILARRVEDLISGPAREFVMELLHQNWLHRLLIDQVPGHPWMARRPIDEMMPRDTDDAGNLNMDRYEDGPDGANPEDWEPVPLDGLRMAEVPLDIQGLDGIVFDALFE